MSGAPSLRLDVIPAQAGIQEPPRLEERLCRIPFCAGMTAFEEQTP